MEKRNIVLITFDSLRADHCSFMGYHRKTTPNMDKIARKGVVFKNAISPGPRTIPAMPQIFTGKLMNFVSTDKFFGERNNVRRHLRMYKTIPQLLKTLGYTTGAFSPNAYTSRYFNFDKGFDYFQDFFFSRDSHRKIFEKMVAGSKLYTYIRNVRNFILKQEAFRSWESYYNEILDWVRTADKPFFLWVFLLDTHLPWIVPRKYRKWCNWFDMFYYNWIMFRLLGKYVPDYPRKSVKKFINLYDSAIYYADAFVGRLLKDLSDFDPVYIIHADHGEEFGERGYFGHYYPNMYRENLNVPFLIYNIDSTWIHHNPISLVRLVDIIVNIANNSFNRIPFDKFSNEFIISKDYDYINGSYVISIIFNNWKYIFSSGRYELLFNLEEDWSENINLANSNENVLKLFRKLSNKIISRDNYYRKIQYCSKKLK